MGGRNAELDALRATPAPDDTIDSATTAARVKDAAAPAAAESAPHVAGVGPGSPAPLRYVVQSRLGEGAMGEVVLVRDPAIGRDVALKTVHSRHGEVRELRLRLEREARVQGQLE